MYRTYSHMPTIPNNLNKCEHYLQKSTFEIWETSKKYKKGIAIALPWFCYWNKLALPNTVSNNLTIYEHYLHTVISNNML